MGRDTLTASPQEQARLGDDLRAMALAHAALDEIGVPRSTDTGQRLTLFGRIEALRAGKYDPERLTVPADARPRPCPTCGILAALALEER